MVKAVKLIFAAYCICLESPVKLFWGAASYLNKSYIHDLLMCIQLTSNCAEINTGNTSDSNCVTFVLLQMMRVLKLWLSHNHKDG